MSRTTGYERDTKETQIALELNIDGNGRYDMTDVTLINRLYGLGIYDPENRIIGMSKNWDSMDIDNNGKLNMMDMTYANRHYGDRTKGKFYDAYFTIREFNKEASFDPEIYPNYHRDPETNEPLYPVFGAEN